MKNNKSYGLIEVLISVSIFLLVITNAGGFVCNALLHTRKTEELHIVTYSVLDLNEQLYMFDRNNSREKKQLISTWAMNFKQRAPEYCVEIIEQLDTIQVTIRKQNSQFVLNIVA